MKLIAPSMLASDFGNLEHEISIVNNSIGFILILWTEFLCLTFPLEHQL
jgi:hypothetical protein